MTTAQQELDPSTGVPLYRQIREILRSEITDGSMDPAIPMTEAQLLERFGVSRAPIRQALRDLADEGYVYRKQGKGTFPVPGRRIERGANVRPGALYQHLTEQGLKTKTAVSDLKRVVPPEHVQERLGLPKEEKLLHFVRLIWAEDIPVAHSRIYLRAPADFNPTQQDLEGDESAFELLERNFGIALTRSDNEAWATAATEETAGHLDVTVGSPLLAIETIFITNGGAPGGYRLAMHRSDEFKYQFTTGG
ncbi:MAG: GntR family transcriptional regulator [Corynebacterium sp.]|nr:GntR family transcriptional regulator [Corynebacterium sp.]